MAQTRKGNKMFDVVKFPALEGKIEIEKAIKSVTKRYASLKPVLHQTLYSAALHAAKHNDTTLITSLYNTLTDEMNKGKGIAVWLKEFTNLEMRKAKDGTMQWLKPKADAQVLFTLAGIETPFYEMPEVKGMNAQTPFSLTAAIAILIKKAEKAADAGTIVSETEKIIFEQLGKIGAILPKPAKNA